MLYPFFSLETITINGIKSVFITLNDQSAMSLLNLMASKPKYTPRAVIR
jgi:hypothetical protein